MQHTVNIQHRQDRPSKQNWTEKPEMGIALERRAKRHPPAKLAREGAAHSTSGPGSPGGSGRRRLASGERRRQLLRVAAELMTRHGIDGVQVADVAAAAGVTRQLVYRFFPDRRALITGVLEGFVDELTQRFGQGVARTIPGSLHDVTRTFVEAVCDTIEVNGVGPWHLLDSKGPDPEIARVAREMQDRLVGPWRGRIAQVTGASAREAATVARMIVAAGRAVLELWYDGTLSRKEAVRDATRGVAALLEAFTRTEGARSPRR
jgi:AcrR family transcriptional regulator